MTIAAAHVELIDRLKKLGSFDNVGESEPMQPPGKGMYAAVWYDGHEVSRDLSTMTRAGLIYRYMVRLYRAANSQPEKDIDPDLRNAIDAFRVALSGANQLASSGYRVDVMGAYSDGLRPVWDYVDFGRKQLYRTVDLTVPIFSVAEEVYA